MTPRRGPSRRRRSHRTLPGPRPAAHPDRFRRHAAGRVRGSDRARGAPGPDRRDRRRVLHGRGGTGQPAAVVGGRPRPVTALERRHLRGLRRGLRQRQRQRARADGTHAGPGGAAEARSGPRDRAGGTRRRRRPGRPRMAAGRRDRAPDPRRGAHGADRAAHHLRRLARRLARAVADRPGDRVGGHLGGPGRRHHGPAGRPVDVPARGRRPASHRGRRRMDRAHGGGRPARARRAARAGDLGRCGHLRHLGRRRGSRRTQPPDRARRAPRQVPRHDFGDRGVRPASPGSG